MLSTKTENKPYIQCDINHINTHTERTKQGWRETYQYINHTYDYK